MATPYRRDQLIKRGQIVALHEAGHSIRSIARRLGVSPTTVTKWINRNEETGDLTDLERRPRSRVTTPAQDAAIERAVEDDPFTNAVRIREELQLNTSAETVRRRLHGSGLHHRVPAVKDRLTDQHRAARLAFARRYVEKRSRLLVTCSFY
ncbi:hypothetical protein Pcinc_001610 [Petrolisthes cinctipes]|uniref:Transposase Tc1-like domain-containing protein n=1 Tax=Petrolisthes cinctipes TaxID=88211 RepID=A0AAE1GMG8_PETCI|nr:hypothetical protein Pcinc_001610 [Petrolisthes cinctipes]